MCSAMMFPPFFIVLKNSRGSDPKLTLTALHLEGWVVIDPFMGSRGRIYLPRDDKHEIDVIVGKPGDQALLTTLEIRQIINQLAG